jgi:hypothetical protein
MNIRERGLPHGESSGRHGPLSSGGIIDQQDACCSGKKMTPDYPRLYKKYFVDKGDERLGLFRLLAEKFSISSGLYPGSFTHITPSLVIPDMVYVDLDKRCKSFFGSDTTRAFVEANKEYARSASYRFHQADFQKGFPESEESFDILISFYAGFISKYCGKYLRTGGILLANNSHGDAPLAYAAQEFAFLGAVTRNGNRFSYTEDELHTYFIRAGGKSLDTAAIEKTMRGPAYVRKAYAYIFKKLRPGKAPAPGTGTPAG